MPAPPPARCAAAPAAGRPRRGRLAVAAGALAAVLWLHWLLIGALRPAPRAGARGEAPAELAALQVRTLAPPRAGALGPAPAPPPLAPVSAAAGPPPPVPVAVPVPVPEPRPAAPTAEPAPVPAPGPAPERPGVPAAPRDASAGEDGAPATEAAAGEPPPVYPTRLPPPVQLRYRLRYHGQGGEARLAWWHDGQAYRLRLDGRAADGTPLVEQLSQGAVDAAGLAPQRFVDRRRGRGWLAANVERPAPWPGGAASAGGGAPPGASAAPGRVRYSGPRREHPAWPGGQDRLSWVAQLAAILAAAPQPPPAAWRLYVVDARGEAGVWDLVDQGEVTLDAPLGAATARHWRRDPPQPEGLRVEAWTDAARGHWPLRLRFTAGRGGEVFELDLAEEPAPGP